MKFRCLVATVLIGLLPAYAGAQEPAPQAGVAADAPAAEDNPFDIWEFRVSGNTLLPQTEIERLVYPHLGEARGMTEVEAARLALETRYRDSGFPTVLVDIPEQDVSEGVVRLKVTEGRVDRLRVTGARYYSNGRIRAELPSLAQGTVPHLPTLQEELARFNQRSADRSVTPVTRAGRTPGTVEFELQVKDRVPLHASLEVNNRYTLDTEKLRLNASLGYGNLWQRDDSITMNYQISPEDVDQVKVLVGTYLLRPLSSRMVFAFYGVDSNSDVATVGDVNVVGNGQTFGTRAIMPLSYGGAWSDSVVLGVDYKDFNDNVGFAPEEETDPLVTAIDYFNFSAAYNSSRGGERARTSWSTGMNFGLRGLGNSRQEFEDKRFKARPDYFYLTGGIEHTQVLFASHWLLYLSGSAQLSQQPLISNEQFTMGGMGSVRGYLEAEQLADYGAQARVELRTPRLLPKLTRVVDELEAFVFYDWAGAQLIDPLPDQISRFQLASTGVGLRYAGGKGWQAAFDWAWPLLDAAHTQSEDTRVDFSVKYGR
jgi:hemolysin activation/secretion protein